MKSNRVITGGDAVLLEGALFDAHDTCFQRERTSPDKTIPIKHITSETTVTIITCTTTPSITTRTATTTEDIHSADLSTAVAGPP